MIKFFWKPSCARCPEAKALLEGMDCVDSLNIDDVEGLAEAAFYGVMATPTIIVVDESGRELHSWRGEVPSRMELRSHLN